jgi:hypothetical protein
MWNECIALVVRRICAKLCRVTLLALRARLRNAWRYVINVRSAYHALSWFDLKVDEWRPETCGPSITKPRLEADASGTM